ncbi:MULTISPECIES: GNAT family N-acetyltransferase [Legionella]|uniref:GNAT family acetyltransferase n=1 Tax=Legionella drozanskii LLAP-1 TaxID=1212489 RepID=A0A0W0TC39_9GAMM|nr:MULTISPECIES: GNAT family N-acetyltransferase [Legionella]KTC93153.1 GNAT family acetyltransferase [Legionella drozanskii LLAP-1]PJE09344.1 MAG: N-acetyltransferase [Legionella sp.]
MKKIHNLTFLEAKEEISYSDINGLAESVGWGNHFYPSEEQWKATLASSSYIAYVKALDQLICFGRILEDGQMCMFYDICVHPDYQRQYIGSSLMKHLISKIKDKSLVSIGLFVWQGNSKATEFYRKFGFETSTAMELKKYMRNV